MSDAVTSTLATPGLEGERAPETEAVWVVVNSKSLPASKIVPAGKLIGTPSPF